MDQLLPVQTAPARLRPVQLTPARDRPVQVTVLQLFWPTTAGPQAVPVHTEPLKVPPVQLRCAFDAAVQVAGTQGAVISSPVLGTASAWAAADMRSSGRAMSGSYLSFCRRTISVIQMGAYGDVQFGGVG